jgi:EmrB/QacA subfamily drug resistance transporter
MLRALRHDPAKARLRTATTHQSRTQSDRQFLPFPPDASEPQRIGHTIRQMVSPSSGSRDAIPEERRHPPDWLILSLVCLAQFMVVLDISIVNVALPSIQKSLGFSEVNLQWVVTAYALTFGGLLLFGGRLADLFGRKRIFLLGLVLFTAASLLGGFAQNQATLIIARALQGVGAAVLSPATLTILTVTFTEERARAKALGVWTAVAAGGGAAGALFGGILTDVLSWRWILFVNVPIGIAAFLLARFYLRESRAEGERQRLDIAGSLTVTAGLIVLVYGIVSTDRHAWSSAQTIITLVVAAVLLAAFVLIEARLATHPLMPLRLFKSRFVTGANVVMFLFGAAMFAMWFFLTLYLQQVLGYSPLITGLTFLPQTAAIAIGATVAGRLVPRIGPRPLMVAGGLLAAGGLYWLSFISASGTYWTSAFGGGVMCTLGMGLAFTPIAVAATGGIPREEAGLASGVMNTSRQIGASVGLAVLSTVAASRIASLERGHQVSSQLARTAMTAGYARGFEIGALLALAGVALTFIIPARVPAPVPRSGGDLSETLTDGIAAPGGAGPAPTQQPAGAMQSGSPEPA